MWYIDNSKGYPVIWGNPLKNKEDLKEHHKWVDTLPCPNDIRNIMKAKARNILKYSSERDYNPMTQFRRNIGIRND